MNGPKKVYLIDKASMDALNMEIGRVIYNLDYEINRGKKQIDGYGSTLRRKKERYEKNKQRDKETVREKKYVDIDIDKAHLQQEELRYKDLITQKQLEIANLKEHKKTVEKIKRILAEGVGDYE